LPPSCDGDGSDCRFGWAVTPRQVTAAPFVVRVKLVFLTVPPAMRRSTPNTSSHIIRKVILRQIAILNYVNPF
jgi:hypothetical protein